MVDVKPSGSGAGLFIVGRCDNRSVNQAVISLRRFAVGVKTNQQINVVFRADKACRSVCGSRTETAERKSEPSNVTVSVSEKRGSAASGKSAVRKIRFITVLSEKKR